MSKWLPKGRGAPKWPLPEKPAEGWAFPTGAYVKDENKVEYYATAAQAEAYQQRADEEALSDADFWVWFRQFRTDYFIFPVTNWGKANKNQGLSGWWQYDLHGEFGSATSNADRKLTLALRAVSTTVRIVDDSTPPYTVEWASTSLSSTDIEGRRIVINPKPILKPGKLTSAEAIDIETAFGLHEAGHARHTSKVYGPLMAAKPGPWSVAMFLANVIEDVRTERLTSLEYPGFAGYFPLALAYVWDDMRQDESLELPEQWGTSLKDCLNAIVITLKWSDKAKDTLTDQSFLDEMPWWEEWSDRYQRGITNLLTAVEEGLERLRQTSPQIDAEMDVQAASDAAPYNHGEEVAVEGTIRACTSGHSDQDVLDGETAEAVRANVQEGLREWKPAMDHGGKKPTTWVRHPRETEWSRGAYVGKPSGLTDRLKSVLQFRPELPRWSDRLLKHGELDEEQLYRFGFQDFRMFEKQVVESYPNAQVSLLVDMSGSMTGAVDRYASPTTSKVQVAQELAQLFVGALSTMPGVQPKVFGHTGDLDGDAMDGSAEFYELWEPGEPMTRLGLITTMNHGDNFDGYAIEWCVRELLDRGGMADQRLLVVLSDGEPAGYDYGDSEAIRHVRSVTDWADKQQVFVIQVAIDPQMRPTHQAKMFRHWVQFTSAEGLPRELAKTLSSFLNR